MKGGIGLDFARQVAERNAAGQPTKKFKGSAAPKGSRLASGYQDRTLERRDVEDDERGARINALEEQMKLGQLDQSTFEALRDQITGGDVSATHLVKGLDRRLLERIRQGEDVLGTGQKEADEDIDEELDRLEEIEVARVERDKTEKKGEMAPPPSIAGGKRSRDQILADLKAQRKAVADARAAARPELGSHFRDISAKAKSGTRIERDEKGREVRITVDEDGNVKKKVRKVQNDESATESLSTAEKPIKFLDEGITLPTLKEQIKVAEKEESEEEDDIFADAGTEYNPLGDDADDSEDDSSDDEEGQVISKTSPKTAPERLEEPRTAKSVSPSTSPEVASETKGDMLPPPVPAPASTKPENTIHRNYFKSATSDLVAEAPPESPFNDANFLAAIKKASALSNVAFSLGGSKDENGNEEDEAAREARLKKRAAMLAGNDRDLDDMDLGFGSSRFGDEEDAEESNSKTKLSEWKGNGAADDDDDDAGKKTGGEKKKRSRKRKGDKNSAKDVLGVLERRKASGK